MCNVFITLHTPVVCASIQTHTRRNQGIYPFLIQRFFFVVVFNEPSYLTSLVNKQEAAAQLRQ